MFPVISIRGYNPTQIRNGQFLSEYANMYEHEINEHFGKEFSSETFSLWFEIKIPILVFKIMFNGKDYTKYEFRVFKQENSEYAPYSEHLIEKTDTLDNLSLLLIPGIFVFEVSGCSPFSTKESYLKDSVISQNLFVSVIDGIGKPLKEVGEKMPNSKCMGGITHIGYKYRVIDTYLGFMKKQPDSCTLVPGAWYHYSSEKELRTVLWTGSETIINKA